MNKGRLADLNAIRAKLDAISIDLGNLKDEEEIALGNLDEGKKPTQKGDGMRRTITALDDAIRCVDEADSYLGIAVK